MPDRPLANPVKTQVSYASLLHNTGFGEAVGLAARINAWRVLLRSHGAQLLLCHHAPTAAVAARSLDIPVCYIGSGFMVPPLRTPFPSFRIDMRIDDGVLRQNEAHVLENLNRALEILELDPYADLQCIYRGGRPAMLSYRQTDHYGVDRPEVALGLPDFSHGAAPAWPAGGGPRIFAYLRPVPQLEQVLEGLRDCRARVLLRLSAVPRDSVTPFLRPGITLVEGPLNFARAAEECDAFVTYSPHSTVVECLLAGKPGVLIPDNQERTLVTWRAVRMGAGVGLTGPTVAAFVPVLHQVLEDPSYTAAAQRFAAEVSHIDRKAILPDLLDCALADIA